MSLNKNHVAIGLLIKEHRQLKKISQADLAEKLGYDTAQFISNIERGVSKVPLNILGQLIVILDVPEKKVIQLEMDAFQAILHEELLDGKRKASGQ